jgi:hypothetical protein
MSFVLSVASKLYVLNVITLIVIMLSVIMLNVMAPLFGYGCFITTVVGRFTMSFFVIIAHYSNKYRKMIVKMYVNTTTKFCILFCSQKQNIFIFFANILLL